MALDPPRPPSTQAARLKFPSFRIPHPAGAFHQQSASLMRESAPSDASSSSEAAAAAASSPFPVLTSTHTQIEAVGMDLTVMTTRPLIPHARSGMVTRVLESREREQQAATSNKPHTVKRANETAEQRSAHSAVTAARATLHTAGEGRV